MQPLTVYYDGQCPLCQAEILFLRSRNRANLLDFVDLQDESFKAAGHGVSCEAALAVIHGRLADGEILTGVRVFAEAYRRAGLNVAARVLSIACLQPLLGVVYGKFAKYRHGLSRTLGPPLLAAAKRFCAVPGPAL